MARRRLLHFLIIPLLALLAACAPWWIAPLPLTGDANDELVATKIGFLADFLEQNGMDANAALIIANDGVAARIGRNSFDKLLLQKTWKGWRSISSELSPTCNLNKLQEACLLSTTPAPKLAEIRDFSSARAWSPYGLQLHGFVRQGAAERNGRQVVKYAAGVPASPWSLMQTAVTTRGELLQVQADTLRITGTCVMAGADTIAALWTDPQNDIRDKVDELAGQASRDGLLICVVDGLSHPMYEHLQALGMQTSRYIQVGPASVLRPDDANIFRALAPGDYTVTAAPITLPTGVRRSMVHDGDNDGDTGAEVAHMAISRLPDRTGAMLVHFTSLLDAQRANGPFSDEAVAQATQALAYVDELAEAWAGETLLVGRPDPEALDLRHKSFGLWGKQ